MKAVIVGSRGHLGNALVRQWIQCGVEVLALDYPQLDITSRMFTLSTITPLKPDVIVNAAGVEQIEWLQTHPNTARTVHVQGTATLREAAKRTDALLLQFSTAEVFGDAKPKSGKKGFRETEIPDPQSVYAKTKLDSERAAAELERHLIVRTSLIFGETTDRSRGSLVDTMLKAVMRTRNFRVLSDLYVSPSWTDHLARASLSLVEHSLREKTYGIFHLTNGGSASYCEIARELAAKTGLPLQIEPITREEYGEKAPRNSFGVLDGSKYHALEGVVKLPSWKNALQEFLQSRSVF